MGGMRERVIPDGSNRATQKVGRPLCIQEAAGSVVGADFLITQGTSDTVPEGHEMFRDPKMA